MSIYGMMTELRRATGAVAVLRAVHGRPGIERVAVARETGMTSGFVTETVVRLAALDLVTERPAPPTGGRGRPTTTLHPHPRGPLVVAAAIGHETWKLAVAQLGGSEAVRAERAHRRDPDQVLGELGEALGSVRRRYGRRIRVVAVSVPGTVVDNHLAQAANLGWDDIDLGVLWPRERDGRALLAGNDASFAAIAEARRGAAVGAGSVLHLYIDAGIGGAVIEGGRLFLGATGTAGEFGHMPFGDPAQQCRCGARGCWNTTLDGAALARALNQPQPTDEVSYLRHVLAVARAAPVVPHKEVGAVQAMAGSAGRGVAGLVNAFDPDIVTFGGLGRELLEVAGDHVYAAYLAGLMHFRHFAPPPLVPAHFGDDAPLVGATEEAFSAFLTEEGLRSWSPRSRRSADL
jgi:predicted NBD/HSP70 family sugar kinase